MDISPATLRSFLTLARELHFGRAAALLEISTPTLSKQIGKLEAQVGKTLFFRTPRSIELTPAGSDFLPVAQDAVAALRGLDIWLQQSTQVTRDPVLNIGISAGAIGGHTAGVLAQFRLTVPRVRLEFHRFPYDGAYAGLLDGSVDVVLTSGHPGGPPPGVNAKLTLADPRVLVVGKQHRFAQRNWVTLDETTEETYIRIGDESFEPMARSWMIDPRPDGRHLHWGAQADDYETLLDLCAAGLGVNLGVESARFRYSRPDISFVPVRDAPAGTLVAALAAANRDPLALEFIAVAREVCRRPVIPGQRGSLGRASGMVRPVRT